VHDFGPAYGALAAQRAELKISQKLRGTKSKAAYRRLAPGEELPLPTRGALPSWARKSAAGGGSSETAQAAEVCPAPEAIEVEPVADSDDEDEDEDEDEASDADGEA
jgi:hypothetical protein